MRLIRTLLIAAALVGVGFGAAVAKTGAPTQRTVVVPACSWDRPGHNPFMGDVVAAIDRYQDIPVDVRERLKARMAKRDYDDLVSIKRDSIAGRKQYGSTISEMHFGTSSVCQTVTRTAWTDAMQERGLVYCEGRECILVPTVCRNVSRITGPDVADEKVAGTDPDAPLEFTPPGAGPQEAPGERPGDLALDDEPSFATPNGVPGASIASGPNSDTGPSSPGTSSSNGPGPSPFPGPGSFPFFPVFPTFLPPVVTTITPPPDVVAAVPEPQTWALMGVGLVALLSWQRRRRAR